MSQTSGSSPVPSYSICESCGQSHNFDKNHVYDYPDEIEDELLCQICCQPLVDPVDTPCSHTFCYTCLRDHLKQKKSCPIDSSPVRNRDVRPASILVRRLLDKLTVVCPNNAYCDDTMQRCALEVHLKYQCGGSYVSCPRMPMGCEYRGPRCELEEHLWMCPYGEDKDEDGELLQIRDNEYCLLEIPKGTAELGLRVIPVPELKGGGVTVDQIFPEGVAAKDNRLRLGDRIVEINDVDITQKTFAQACLALGGTTPLLKLVIYRQSVDESVSSDTGSESDQIVLTRKNGQNLGIQIMTRKGRTGVFVCGLLPNSAAMDCGKISIGDQIIEVNGVDMRQATVDEAADIMASSSQVSLVLSKKSSSKGSSLRSLAHVYDEIQTPSGLLVGQEKHVIINKKPYESFGMSIAGGKGPSCGDMPVYINDLISDGIVALTKQIQRGDILLALNEVSLVGKTHSEAVQIIKSMPAAGTIHFHLIQGDAVEGNPNCLSPDWPAWMEKFIAKRCNTNSYIEMDVTLHREANEELGFSLVGGAGSHKGDSPVFIKYVSSKGVAGQTGRLKSGDEILKVNRISVDNMTQAEVVNLIKRFSRSVTLTIRSELTQR